MFSNSPRIRQTIYAVAVAAQIASFFVQIFDAAIADALLATAGVLATVAGVTALSNIHPNAVIEPYENGLGDLPKVDGV
jgi:hypothetical protein